MKADKTLDCFGLLCPMPIIRMNETMGMLKKGKVLEVVATDEGIRADAAAWCASTGHELLKVEEEQGDPPVFRVYIRK